MARRLLLRFNMALASPLSIGASGLSSQSRAMATVADNIANVDTVGFKSSRASFADVLARSLQGDGSEIGQGSRQSEVQRVMTQGSLQSTGVTTDLAVNGDGWFMVSGSAGGADTTYYTRAGQFCWSPEGKLVNGDGLAVQGFNAGTAGALGTTVEDLRIQSTQLAPVPTRAVSVAANLSAAAPTVTAPLSLTNPTATSSFSTNVTVYDSLGGPHDVLLCFRKVAAGIWNWHAMVDGAQAAGGTPGTWDEQATGSLVFDSAGRLQSEVPTFSSFAFVGAAPGQSVAFDFGDSVATDGGTGLKGTTSFASSSTMTCLRQDGYSAGALTSITVDPDGTIRGLYSNGQERTRGMVLLARFPSDEQLERVGASLYAQTRGSGSPLVSQAGSGGAGSIVAGTVERSNVDLSREFVDMIAFQRGLAASARTVTTADQLLQELVQLKR